MGNELVIVRGVRPLQAIDPRNMDTSGLQKFLEKNRPRSGMPGDRLSFKKGVYFMGKDQTQIAPPFDLVVLVHSVVTGWRIWVDKRPVVLALCQPMLGEDLPRRDEMGTEHDNDKSTWELNDEGIPQDPIKQFISFVVRTPGTDELNHFETDSQTARYSVQSLLGDYMDESKRRVGKLPIVTFGAALRPMKANAKKSYFVPTFEISGWEAVANVDGGEAFGGEVIEGTAVDVTELVDTIEGSAGNETEAVSTVPLESKTPIKTAPPPAPVVAAKATSTRRSGPSASQKFATVTATVAPVTTATTTAPKKNAFPSKATREMESA